MKKIFNNKGMTLIEIILSIGLVSIVMVQVLNILVDLKDEQLLGKDKTRDLTNRSIIVKTVQNDFRTHKINKVRNCKDDASATVHSYTKKSCVEISMQEGALEVNYRMFTATKNSEDYFIYGKMTGGTYLFEAWKLNSGTYKTGGSCNVTFTNYESNGKSYFSIYYPVQMSKVNENSTMTFDLEFLYYVDAPTTNAITFTGLSSCTIPKTP